MAFESTVAAVALLVGRVLFGGVLAFMGLNHFLNAEQMTGYAGAKGVPAPKIAVLGSGAMLVVGGLAVAVGAYATIGALLIALFLLVTTPMIHDFWAAPEEEQQSEMTQFLKNAALLGAALAIAAVATESWPYALDVGLF